MMKEKNSLKKQNQFRNNILLLIKLPRLSTQWFKFQFKTFEISVTSYLDRHKNRSFRFLNSVKTHKFCLKYLIEISEISVPSMEIYKTKLQTLLPTMFVCWPMISTGWIEPNRTHVHDHYLDNRPTTFQMQWSVYRLILFFTQIHSIEGTHVFIPAKYV